MPSLAVKTIFWSDTPIPSLLHAVAETLRGVRQDLAPGSDRAVVEGLNETVDRLMMLREDFETPFDDPFAATSDEVDDDALELWTELEAVLEDVGELSTMLGQRRLTTAWETVEDALVSIEEALDHCTQLVCG